MKSAEGNMKKVLKELFSKQEKDIEETKEASHFENSKILSNIKEIKNELLERLSKNEAKFDNNI